MAPPPPNRRCWGRSRWRERMRRYVRRIEELGVVPGNNHFAVGEGGVGIGIDLGKSVRYLQRGILHAGLLDVDTGVDHSDLDAHACSPHSACSGPGLGYMVQRK